MSEQHLAKKNDLSEPELDLAFPASNLDRTGLKEPEGNSALPEPEQTASIELDLDIANFDLNEIKIQRHLDNETSPLQQQSTGELTEQQISSGNKFNSKVFRHHPTPGYTETILDKIVTWLANLLAKIDAFFGIRMLNKKNKKNTRRVERELELEEFMNERAKDAIGKKRVAESLKREKVRKNNS